MPNLVVYVPADVARALQVKGVSEDIQRRACKEVLVGLANGGLGAGEAVASSGGGTARVASGGRVAEAPSAPAPRSRKCPADTPKGTRCKLCGEKH